MNRYPYPAAFTYPSGYAASNLIPWPAVTQNHDAIAYYQRVLVQQNATSTVATMRVDGLWGPNTQREVAAWQSDMNREIASGGDDADSIAKHGVSRLRADGVLDEATQRVLQIVGQANNVPRGAFATGSTSHASTTHSFVGGGGSSAVPAQTTAHYTAPLSSVPAPVATTTSIPWGTIAIVGGVVGIAAIAIAFTPKDRR